MPVRISLDDLEGTRRSFAPEVRADPARETFTLAVSVVRHFFGHQWYLDHVFQDAEGSRPEGFMRIDYTPGPMGESKTNRVYARRLALSGARLCEYSEIFWGDPQHRVHHRGHQRR